VFLEPYRDDPATTAPDNGGQDGFSSSQRGHGAFEYPEHEQRNDPTKRGSQAPSLPNIDAGEAIELPSLLGSKSSSQAPTGLRIRPPTIPRKSSRRRSTIENVERHGLENNLTQSPEIVLSSPHHDSTKARKPYATQPYLQTATSHPSRLPFGSKSSSPRSDNISTASTASSANNMTDDENPIHRRHRTRQESTFGHFASDTRNDLHSNMRYVLQHRASDNIHRPSPDEPTFGGSTAEVVSAPSG
jgi:hypothetical protein